MSGKARSFRLSKENEMRLEFLQESLKADNPNMTLNRVIENYNRFVRAEPYIKLIEGFLDQIREDLKGKGKK